MGKFIDGVKNGCKKTKKWYKDNAYWINPGIWAGLSSGLLITEGYIIGKRHTEKKYADKILNAAIQNENANMLEAPKEEDKPDYTTNYTMRFFDDNGDQYGDDIGCTKVYADDMFDCIKEP